MKKWLEISIGIFAGVFAIFVFLFLGALIGISILSDTMSHYDLYNCVLNNAASNGYNQNPVMIQKIQDECVCFRQHNYNGTEVFETRACVGRSS
jgi:hypothetical protein